MQIVKQKNTKTVSIETLRTQCSHDYYSNKIIINKDKSGGYGILTRPSYRGRVYKFFALSDLPFLGNSFGINSTDFIDAILVQLNADNEVHIFYTWYEAVCWMKEDMESNKKEAKEKRRLEFEKLKIEFEQKQP